MRRCGVAWSLAACALASAQTIGRPPSLDAGSRDLASSYPLPALRDGPGQPLAAVVANLQAGRRAGALRLDARSATAAWAAADARLQRTAARLQAKAPAPLDPFDGDRASQLNALLSDPGVRGVRVVSERIEVDEPVYIGRSNVWLDLGRAELRAAARGPRFLLHVDHASHVTVRGGAFLAGRWGALVSGGRDVALLDGRYDGLGAGGVVFTNTQDGVLARSRLARLAATPVLVHGASAGTAVVHNEIVANRGASNWHAGIVVSDRTTEVARDPSRLLHRDGYSVREEPIGRRLHGPRDTLLAFNHIAQNRSSGVYSDGGRQTVVFQNRIEANAKEGLCLDNGSTANVVAMNLIRLNGQRWGMTDADLRRDFVADAGRLADGSAAAKLPGISIDNALYNVVYANQIDRNYGGGVKMVRTAFFNLIGLNVLTSNAEGTNAGHHFFGIELGAAIGDVPSSDLDFTPSRGNVVFANAIQGRHYAGIFFGRGSADNDAFDNTIFGATHWAIEQVEPQPNGNVNNVTNLRSRNVEATLPLTTATR